MSHVWHGESRVRTIVDATIEPRQAGPTHPTVRPYRHDRQSLGMYRLFPARGIQLAKDKPCCANRSIRSAARVLRHPHRGDTVAVPRKVVNCGSP